MITDGDKFWKYFIYTYTHISLLFQGCLGPFCDDNWTTWSTCNQNMVKTRTRVEYKNCNHDKQVKATSTLSMPCSKELLRTSVSTQPISYHDSPTKTSYEDALSSTKPIYSNIPTTSIPFLTVTPSWESNTPELSDVSTNMLSKPSTTHVSGILGYTMGSTSSLHTSTQGSVFPEKTSMQSNTVSTPGKKFSLSDIYHCLCPCSDFSGTNKWAHLMLLNLTTKEMKIIMKKELEELLANLYVKKKSTNAYQRTLISANDDRKSAARIGSVGVVIIVLGFGLIIIFDCINTAKSIYHRIPAARNVNARYEQHGRHR